MNGSEILNMDALNEAYQKRLTLLHSYIEPTIKRNTQSSKPKKKAAVHTVSVAQTELDEAAGIADLVRIAKSSNADIVDILKEHIAVVEVAV